MSTWSHLPNSHHIYRVIESAESHPEIWSAAWDTIGDMASDAIWDAATAAVRDAARVMVLDAVWIRIAARGAAGDAAWGAITALIAYDDCDSFLDMPYEQLKVWALLSEEPAAFLLLPAVIALENIAKKEKQELTI
jgi:hypothetical protein